MITAIFYKMGHLSLNTILCLKILKLLLGEIKQNKTITLQELLQKTQRKI